MLQSNFFLFNLKILSLQLLLLYSHPLESEVKQYTARMVCSDAEMRSHICHKTRALCCLCCSCILYIPVGVTPFDSGESKGGDKTLLMLRCHLDKKWDLRIWIPVASTTSTATELLTVVEKLKWGQWVEEAEELFWNLSHISSKHFQFHNLKLIPTCTLILDLFCSKETVRLNVGRLFLMPKPHHILSGGGKLHA